MLWNQNIIVLYKCFGFRQLNGDLSIFIQYLGDKINIVNMYIDNFRLASNTRSTFDVLK